MFVLRRVGILQVFVCLSACLSDVFTCFRFAIYVFSRKLIFCCVDVAVVGLVLVLVLFALAAVVRAVHMCWLWPATVSLCGACFLASAICLLPDPAPRTRHLDTHTRARHTHTHTESERN